MKYLKSLLFDKEVVNEMRSAKVDPNLLYGQLFLGKITLLEYLEALKKA